jgi:tRNA U34 5-carboxymethylaminomethyl modifying GTPase MnmE/TrmE
LGQPAAGSLEEEAIRRALEQGGQADCWWIVVEAGAGLPPEAQAWLAGRVRASRTLLVINKIDLPQPLEADRPDLEGLAAEKVRISALTGEGFDRLEACFLGSLGLGPEDRGGPGLICPRQAEAVRLALARWSTDNTGNAGRELEADLRGLPGIE